MPRDEACAGKGGKSVARIKALDASLLARPGYEFSTLWWNLRRLYFYIDNNAGTLVNYGARYYRGLPISSSIAESAVNQVVSHRMAKKQQMRWTDAGGLWCKFRARLRLADVARSDSHAFSTAFQISGAVRPLPRRRPSAN
jgi:hypothetical protein